MVKTTTKRSLILELFTPELCLEILKVTLIGNVNTNVRSVYIKELLKEYNIKFTSLGSGTNRMAVLIDGYAVKIALDSDGMIDNKREFLYTKQLQPYVVKVYECLPTGLISVTEYINVFTLQDYHENQDEMKDILKIISNQFLIGDVGVTTKNYTNWGTRSDGSLCILDFAYIYSVKFNIFSCTCDETSLLRYDDNFVNFICPSCGRKYTFGDIRRKISKKQQDKEIGDIKTTGYVLTKPVEEVEYKPEFEPVDLSKKKKNKLGDVGNKKIKLNKRNFNQEWGV